MSISVRTIQYGHGTGRCEVALPILRAPLVLLEHWDPSFRNVWETARRQRRPRSPAKILQLSLKVRPVRRAVVSQSVSQRSSVPRRQAGRFAVDVSDIFGESSQREIEWVVSKCSVVQNSREKNEQLISTTLVVSGGGIVTVPYVDNRYSTTKM
jgi:hypothetical protein